MDFSETFGQVSDRRRSAPRPASSKRQVKARHPRAYSVSYGAGSWFVYQQPAKAVPRGQMAQVVTLGQGETAAKAWADAARRMRAA